MRDQIEKKKNLVVIGVQLARERGLLSMSVNFLYGPWIWWVELGLTYIIIYQCLKQTQIATSIGPHSICTRGLGDSYKNYTQYNRQLSLHPIYIQKERFRGWYLWLEIMFGWVSWERSFYSYQACRIGKKAALWTFFPYTGSKF